MNSQTCREIRFGLVALALAGLLFTLSIVIRGPLDRDTAALMSAALSSNFVPGAVIGLIGGVIQIYGLFGLYRYLTYQRESLIAFLAVMVSPLGIVLVLPLVTFLSVNVPVIAELYQQGNQEVIAVVESSFSGLGLAVLGVHSLCGLAGAFLFAAAIWRDGRLPRWISILYALSGIMLSLSGPGLFVTELLGALVFLMSAGVIAWYGWHESAPGAVQSASQEGVLKPVS